MPARGLLCTGHWHPPTSSLRDLLQYCRTRHPNREARRKESRERPPRTTGALYRHATAAAGAATGAAAGAGGSSVGVAEQALYVNADIPEGSPDPFQVR